MFGWLRREKSRPLEGAPALPREKTYSAESGYVYSYFYLGHRPCRGGVEHVFDVSANRRTFARVSVFLTETALVPWQGAHGRDLTAAERYAIVKLAFQQALDGSPEPGRLSREVRVEPDAVAVILERLGTD